MPGTLSRKHSLNASMGSKRFVNFSEAEETERKKEESELGGGDESMPDTDGSAAAAAAAPGSGRKLKKKPKQRQETKEQEEEQEEQEEQTSRKKKGWDGNGGMDFHIDTATHGTENIQQLQQRAQQDLDELLLQYSAAVSAVSISKKTVRQAQITAEEATRDGFADAPALQVCAVCVSMLCACLCSVSYTS